MEGEHEELLQLAQSVTPAPIAIEAMWDGDTQGWFVEVSAIVQEGTSFSARRLKIFREGGDLRVFTGEVPPWPEATLASAAGAAVARELGVPFFFPSPEHPEDECPHWWQREAATPCERCEVLLLRGPECPWRGLCSRCHAQAERELREAGWTPEERAAPKCHICGSPALGEIGPRVRCATCREKYVDWFCTSCGSAVTTSNAPPLGHTCDTCVVRAQVAALSSEQREAIEQAYAKGTFTAARMLGEALGYSAVKAYYLLLEFFPKQAR